MTATARVNKFPRYLLAIIIAYISILVAMQSLTLSNTFSTLNFYCIDDSAFQASLAGYAQKHGWDLLCMNDYGYGWLFWFPMLIITLPAMMLKEATGICWLLIYLPRLYALFFSVLCSVLCYCIVGRYTKNEWIRMAIVIAMPLYPAGGYYAGRFSTVSVVAFFSMLAMWLVIRKDALTRKDLRWALLAFAAAMGIKASAVVAAPALALIILNRYDWKVTLKNCKLWLEEIVIALVALIGFASPAILLFPLAPNQAYSSLKLLGSYLLGNQTLQGTFDPMALISYSTFQWTAAVFILLLSGLAVWGCYSIYRQKKAEMIWRDYVALPAGYGIGVLYLCLTVHSGLAYQFMYATAISFLLPFGLLLLEKFSARRGGNFFIICACVVCCIAQLFYIQQHADSGLLAYSHDIASQIEKIESTKDVRSAILEADLDEVAFLADYQSPYMAYNPYEDHNLAFSCTMWDDLSNWKDFDCNVLLLSKSARGFLDESSFQQQISNLDLVAADTARRDREERTRLVDTGEFNDHLWNLAYEDKFSRLYIRADQYAQQSDSAA